MRARSGPSSNTSPRMPRPITSTVSPIRGGRVGAAASGGAASASLRCDALRRPRDEAAQRRGSGLRRSSSSTARPSACSVAQERARRLEVLAPAGAAPRAQVGVQRLASRRARRASAGGLGGGGVARRVELAPAGLQSLDGAGDVAAFARQQPLRRSRGRAPGGRGDVRSAARGSGRRCGSRDGSAARRWPGSRSNAATSSAGSASANVFTCGKWVVNTSSGPRARRSVRMPTASAAPSTGSVPAPGSSSSTRLAGPAARAMAARFAAWPVKVERSRSIDCSSPMSASTAVKHGRALSSATGMKSPACAMSAHSPRVFSATVLPPAFGPVTASPRWPGRSSRSMGTTGAAAQEEQRMARGQQRAPRRRPAPGACRRAGGRTPPRRRARRRPPARPRAPSAPASRPGCPRSARRVRGAPRPPRSWRRGAGDC